MDEAKAHEIQQWLGKAQHDLRSAKRLFTDEPPLLDTAVKAARTTQLEQWGGRILLASSLKDVFGEV